MAKLEKLTFDKYEVVVDPEKLFFDEDSLNAYIQTEGGHYDNFGSYLALAEKNLQNKEVHYEKVYSERFVEAKDDGSSDKMAEAKAKCDPVAVLVKEQIIDARYIVNRLKNHLKAWDKNHDNAQSCGHMLRKQLDKMNSDVMGGPGYRNSFLGIDNDLDRRIDEAVKVGVEEESSGFSDTLTVENMF